MLKKILSGILAFGKSTFESLSQNTRQRQAELEKHKERLANKTDTDLMYLVKTGNSIEKVSAFFLLRERGYEDEVIKRNRRNYE